MRPPPTLLLTLLATAGLISSCGKGQSSSSTRTVTVQASTGSSTQPSSPSTGGSTSVKKAKAQALAFAQAVNLRPGDVPGYRASLKEKERSDPAEKRASAELQHCMGRTTANKPLLEQSSLNFQRGGSIAQQSVSSAVTVAGTSTVATTELKAIRSARARSCLTRYIEQLFKGLATRGGGIGPVTIAHGTPPAPNATGSFGLRVNTAIVLKANGRTARIPFFLDILGFVYGATEVTLQTSGIPVPFPAATEQQLYTLLLSRARAHHP